MKRFYTILSYFFSVVFHPMLMVLYMLFTLLYINPYLFPYRGEREFGTIALIVFFTSVAIPFVAILLMYSTGLIRSIQLKDRTDRIGPIMATSIAYIWLFLNIKTHNAIPVVFSAFVLGSIIALFVGFFINNFSKISLHAIGMGGFLFAFVHLILSYGRPYTTVFFSGDQQVSVHNMLLLTLLIVFVGAVCSSRLYLKAHKPMDILGGLLVGIFSQIVSTLIYL